MIYKPAFLGPFYYRSTMTSIPHAPIQVPFVASNPDMTKLFSLDNSIADAPVVSDEEKSEYEKESVDSLSTFPLCPISGKRQLQWEFKGLTIWLELEEFDNDITKAISDLSTRHNSPFIPKSHTTAIYGMNHLTVEEAKAKLQAFRERVPQWPTFSRPTGVTQDIAQVGKPGQVCSVAWSELTLATNQSHEDALDALYELFFGENYTRDRPWKPHNSIAYDNPEDNTLSLLDTVLYVSQNPTLLHKERRVEAISLWDTNGKMHEWTCLDRVRFW